MLRRTKIVATLGPASDSRQVIERLIDAGLNVVRLNFSHGDHASHRATIRLVRQVAREKGRTIAILQDLAGPKIRLGELPEGGIELEPGQEVWLAGGRETTEEGVIPVNYPYLCQDVVEGERILLADGLVELSVVEVQEGRLRCRVLVGGVLTSRKGVNLPASNLRVPSFTDKDRADLEVGLEEGVDLVALSFVRHEDDLAEARERLNQVDDPPLLIAKIEKPQAVQRLNQILAQVDGVMVARGDLGVEMRLEEVPLIQKRIIRLAQRAGKPVITATQMLRSMMESPRPTRAEAADVANAVLDGTDALMLSDETAVGSYPVESVATLDRIARVTERALPRISAAELSGTELIPATEGAISHAACTLAEELDCAAIVAGTSSGSSARMVARFRPAAPIIALTPNPVVQRQLALSWGVVPVLTRLMSDAEELFQQAEREARSWGLAGKGDRLVITAGVPMGVAGSTNLVKVIDLA